MLFFKKNSPAFTEELFQNSSLLLKTTCEQQTPRINEAWLRERGDITFLFVR